MTSTVRQFLETYDSLPDDDKHQAAVEILRRYGGAIEGDLPDTALVHTAEELFLAMDAEESRHAPS